LRTGLDWPRLSPVTFARGDGGERPDYRIDVFTGVLYLKDEGKKLICLQFEV